MPLTKIRLNQFSRISLDQYTTLVMVSGSYNQLRDSDIEKIKDWVGKGNLDMDERQIDVSAKAYRDSIK